MFFSAVTKNDKKKGGAGGLERIENDKKKNRSDEPHILLIADSNTDAGNTIDIINNSS